MTPPTDALNKGPAPMMKPPADAARAYFKDEGFEPNTDREDRMIGIAWAAARREMGAACIQAIEETSVKGERLANAYQRIRALMGEK